MKHVIAARKPSDEVDQVADVLACRERLERRLVPTGPGDYESSSYARCPVHETSESLHEQIDALPVDESAACQHSQLNFAGSRPLRRPVGWFVIGDSNVHDGASALAFAIGECTQRFVRVHENEIGTSPCHCQKGVDLPKEELQKGAHAFVSAGVGRQFQIDCVW